MSKNWYGATLSLAVAALFAFVLPIRLPEPDDAVSKEACLTLAERDPQQPLPAVATLEQCIALFPADVELLADLAAVYETSEPARAEATLRRAIDLDAADGDLRLRLGSLLLRRGAAVEASEQAALGLRLQPNRPALLALQRAARAAAASAGS